MPDACDLLVTGAHVVTGTVPAPATLAIRDGWIDDIGSDHSPFLRHEKAAGDQDIFQAPPGHGRFLRPA